MSSTHVNIEIELTAFGIAKDILGSRRSKLIIPLHTSVGQLKDILIDKFPQLKSIRHFSIALDAAYALDSEEVIEGSAITILPPVSGG